MNDYAKVEQAVNLLNESGVPFVLVRRDDVKGIHADRIDMRGMYPDLKACMISAMMRLGRVIMENGYNELKTAGELQNIFLQAVSQLFNSKEGQHEEENS